MRFTYAFASLIVLALFATPALAQPASRSAPERVGLMLDRFQQATNDLELSAEQKTKVDRIFADARKRFESLAKDADQPQKLQQVGPDLQQLRDDVFAVLNDDQRAQLERTLEQVRKRAREREKQDSPGANRPPTTGPAAGARVKAFFERLAVNLRKVELTEEQAAKVKNFFDDLKVKGQKIATDAQTQTGDVAERARELFEETRQRLGQILTPAQRDELRELMRRDGFTPPGGEKTSADGQMKEPQMSGDSTMMMEESSGKRPAAAKSPPAPEVTLAVGPAVGDDAPALTLQKLDGGNVDLSAFKSRVTVLVFGSITSPSFRQRADALDKLQDAFGTRANFFVVYGKEAHPLGEWEVSRNKEEGVSFEQPRSIDARRALATKMRETLKLATPILIDSMENQTATAYGAGANSAYVIGRDGAIVARQMWFEPNTLRRYIEQASTVRNAQGE